MLDSLLVDERVPGDRDADREREQETGRVGVSRESAHEDDSAADEENADGLDPADGRADYCCADEYEHRCAPPRDRVHEGQVRPCRTPS